MKYFLNILMLLFILMLSMPMDAQASSSCCSSDTSCETTQENNHHDEPCGSSTCDCICCGSISIVLLKKEFPENEALVLNKEFVFHYTSLQGALFHSTIWQPPRLG